MEKLLIYLPPFAPDYSGVCSALYELGGLCVIHDASGCTGNYTGFDEPRWYNKQQAVFCSGLRELDAILGDDQQLIEKADAAISDLAVSFAAVLGSPVPMVIGSDMQGIAKEMERETGIPVFGFDTKGLAYYDRGIEEAYLKLAAAFVRDGEEKIANSVNILGATPLDFSINGNVEDMQSLLRNNGWQVLSCWSMGENCSLEQLKKTSQAEVNLVVSVSALKLARHLQHQYGTPYVTGIPVGKWGEKVVIRALEAATEGTDRPFTKTVNQPATHAYIPGKTLIVGEQLAANSIRQALFHDYGWENIDVASFFTMEQAYMAVNDFNIDNESHYLEEVRSRAYQIIFGDPLLKPISRLANGGSFIPFPHVAISSRIHWDDCIEIIGENFNRYLEEEL